MDITITTETNADDGSEQRGPCGTVSVANASMEGVESTTEDKENNGGHAATGESGAGDPKVPSGHASGAFGFWQRLGFHIRPSGSLRRTCLPDQSVSTTAPSSRV